MANLEPRRLIRCEVSTWGTHIFLEQQRRILGYIVVSCSHAPNTWNHR